jgi:hypothetical protein
VTEIVHGWSQAKNLSRWGSLPCNGSTAKGDGSHAVTAGRWSRASNGTPSRIAVGTSEVARTMAQVLSAEVYRARYLQQAPDLTFDEET